MLCLYKYSIRCSMLIRLICRPLKWPRYLKLQRLRKMHIHFFPPTLRNPTNIESIFNFRGQPQDTEKFCLSCSPSPGGRSQGGCRWEDQPRQPRCDLLSIISLCLPWCNWKRRGRFFSIFVRAKHKGVNLSKVISIINNSGSCCADYPAHSSKKFRLGF